MPVTATPYKVPLSSNETSAVGGLVERTRLTSLLPVVLPTCSPITNEPPSFHLRPGCGPHGRQRYTPRGACASSDIKKNVSPSISQACLPYEGYQFVIDPSGRKHVCARAVTGSVISAI